jgi:hypothetical protein
MNMSKRLVAPSRKIGGGNEHTNDGYGYDQRDKSFLKILDHLLLATQLPAQVHEQAKFGKIGSLEREIDNRQFDPPAGIVQTCSKDQGV